MKKSAKILKVTLLLFFLTEAFGLNTAYAQNSKQQKENNKEDAVKKMVESQQYVFVAQSALPMGGRIRQLTSAYELKVTKDTLEADLPYYGRAYTAPIDPTQGGFHFKTKNFEYRAKETKKGGWDISITPKDVTDVRQLTLNISKAGYTSLQVTSNSRQPISFNGYIIEPDKK